MEEKNGKKNRMDLTGIYYKVVTKDLRSAVVISYGIQYAIGKWVKSNIGKIFIFRDLDYAKRFKNMYCSNPGEIWECKVKNVKGIRLKADAIRDIEAFWAGTLKRVFKGRAIKGSYVADEIKLIKRVK